MDEPGVLLLYGSLALLALAVVGSVAVALHRKRHPILEPFRAFSPIPAPYIPSFDERFPPNLDAPPAPPRRCDHCGASASANHSFCGRCGAPACTRCRRFNDRRAKYCGYCGIQFRK